MVEVPQSLADAVRAGKAVLFAGAGLSAPQLPGWTQLLRGLLDHARKQKIEIDSEAVEDLIANSKLLEAADALVAAVQENELYTYLRSVFRKPGLAPGPQH